MTTQQEVDIKDIDPNIVIVTLTTMSLTSWSHFGRYCSR